MSSCGAAKTQGMSIEAAHAYDLERRYPWVKQHEAIARNQRPVFTIERASLAGFYEVAVEYDLKSLPTYKAPRVLDLGANVGIFAWLSLAFWPDAMVRCYEPHPDTHRNLVKNMVDLPVLVTRAAIGREAGSVKLYEGSRNRMCCSTKDLGDQDMEVSWDAEVFAASELPHCDVLKVDVEGCEVDVFEGYAHLETVKCALVECHNQDSVRKVTAICRGNGLNLLDRRLDVLRFIR